MSTVKDFTLSCPLPITDYPTVTLAHGGGGKLMHQLIEKMILPAFNSPLLETRHDGAVFQLGKTRLAFTTDSYVVHPLFFPGGDIGSLAINGTVNDLSMCGARPVYLSWNNLTIAPSSVRAGDVVLLSGDIGRHGIAIMAMREGLEFESAIESDCAPLNGAVRKLIEGNIEVHCLRDLTRGGLGTTLIEIAEATGMQITIDEMKIPVREDVAGACEVLGFDPLYLANEGRMIVFVPEKEAARTLDILRTDQHTGGAVEIGRVLEERGGLVKMKSRIGTTRIIDMLSGEQLPRIC